MSDREDLAPVVEELAESLERLQEELDEERPRRFRDLLRFTEQYTIPAVIGVLEANIRLLKLTAGAIRLSDGRLGDETRRSDAAVETLDRALEDLSGALRGDPTDPEARRILAEARDLRAELRGRLDDATASRTDTRTDDGDADDPHRVPVRSESADDSIETSDPETPDVDVDAELESIKRELDGDDAGEN
ncbi:DUF7547 family protein [Halorarius halobius]|uniref:DUF7547 family protein n=1 Tax=Halorarius halobius TaxID=2962671 RepID=UPI0020CD6C2F|nr:hypothetical protein [Halorarius halobius]